jgi:anaerobic nitric oxide reductase flavorubredoxin
VFGCYGWSGEGNRILAESLIAAGFNVLGEGYKALWSPDGTAMAQAIDYGRKLAAEFR